MVGVAGQTCDQLPRENFLTLRFESGDKASFNIRRHCAALFLWADAACLMVQRKGSSGAGHFRCGAEFLSHTKRLLCRCVKMAAMLRPPRFLPGGSARQARGSRCERINWFIASLMA